MTIERIVNIRYEKFYTVKIEGREHAVALAEDGTLYNIKPCVLAEENENTDSRPLGMSKNEIEALLRNQPSFIKRIATPVGTKQRRRVTSDCERVDCKEGIWL